MKRVPSFATKRNLSVVFSEQPRDRLESKLVIIMVGLPARGKSYLSKKLKRWLNWMGIHTRVFNVGNARRLTAQEPQDSNFFNPQDEHYSQIRESLALNVLNELLSWLKDEGSVGIHDATNSTKKRRKTLLEHIQNEPDTNVLFIESLCTDQNVLETNIRMKTKSPDYISQDPTIARKDFLARLANYEKSYQEVDEGDNVPYVKVIDVGDKVIASHVKGFLESQIVFYLMNVHISPRNIYLVLHGETEHNVAGRIGGDSPLTKKGEAYSSQLVNFFLKEFDIENDEDPEKGKDKRPEIWTSTLGSAVQTAKYFRKQFKVYMTRNLNALDTGYLTGFSEAEVQENYFEEYKNLIHDSAAYRFPGGESYIDVIERAKSLIIELERLRNDVVIISHKSVMRVLYAYFMEIPPQQVPYLDIPRQTVIKLTPTPHGCEELRVHINEQQTHVHNSLVRFGNSSPFNSTEILFSIHYESFIGEELHVIATWDQRNENEAPKEVEEEHKMIWSTGHIWQLRAAVPLQKNSLTLLKYNYKMVNTMTGFVRFENEGPRTLFLPPISKPCSASIILRDSWDVLVDRDLTSDN